MGDKLAGMARQRVRPLLNYIEEVDKQWDNDVVTIVLPEFVAAKWWRHLLHNQTSLSRKMNGRDTLIGVRPHTLAAMIDGDVLNALQRSNLICLLGARAERLNGRPSLIGSVVSSNFLHNFFDTHEHLGRRIRSERIDSCSAPGDSAKGDTFLPCRFDIPNFIADTDRLAARNTTFSEHVSELGFFAED